MLGEIIWEYLVPENLRRPDKPGIGVNPGFDVELLPNNNILFVSPGKGVYEIDRKSNNIWSYLGNILRRFYWSLVIPGMILPN